ncbi:MAG: hypothetical protein M3R59_10180, partial [Verrucomicrobiota bacterium]|nr:hypothetical protein [Verrucomicrobiota bacterium]
NIPKDSNNESTVMREGTTRAEGAEKTTCSSFFHAAELPFLEGEAAGGSRCLIRSSEAKA